MKLDDQTIYGYAGSGPAPNQPISAEFVDASVVDPGGTLCSPVTGGLLQGKAVLILRGGCTFET